MQADRLTHGEVSLTGAVLLFTVVPAVLAAGGNALLGRRGRSLVVAAALAAVLCVALFVVVFLLTVPDGFFQ